MTTVSGYAIRWDERANIGGQFTEQFRRGAFSESIRNNEQLFLYHHGSGDILARTSNNTLKFREDDTGLRYEARIADTGLGRDLTKLIERRDVAGVSVGFFVKRSSDEVWTEQPDGTIHREIVRAELVETSLTPIPAYKMTSVELSKRSESTGSNTERKQRLQADLGRRLKRRMRRRLVAALRRSLEARIRYARH